MRKPTLILVLLAACLSLFGGCLRMGDALSNLNTLALLAAIYGTGYNRFHAYTGSNVMYESTGDGTWTRITMSGPTKIVDVMQTGATLYGLDGVTANSLWKSTDYGRTWSQITVPTGGFTLTRMAACDSNILVATSGTAAHSWFSADKGITWTGDIPITGATDTVSGASCSGSRFFLQVVSSGSRIFTAVAPLTTAAGWTSTSGFTASTPFAVADPMAIGSLVTLEYSQSLIEFTSTNGGLSYVSGPVCCSGNPALAFGNNHFYRAWVSPPSCSIDVANNATSLSWTTANKTIANCGASPSITTGAAGNGIFVAGGSPTSGTSPFVVRYSEVTQTWAVDTLSSPPVNAIGKVLFIR